MKKEIKVPTGISTAWEVKHSNGCKQLLVLDSSFTAKEVTRFVRDYYPHKQFVVTAVEIGVFNLRTAPADNKYKTRDMPLNQKGQLVSRINKRRECTKGDPYFIRSNERWLHPQARSVAISLSEGKEYFRCPICKLLFVETLPDY